MCSKARGKVCLAYTQQAYIFLFFFISMHPKNFETEHHQENQNIRFAILFMPIICVCSTPPDNLSIQEFQKNEAIDVEVRFY